jgi:hypothetical protein
MGPSENRTWLPLFLAVSGIFAIAASLAGLAGVVGWLPLDSLHETLGPRASRGIVTPAPVVLELEPRRSACAACGVVEAIRLAPGGQRSGLRLVVAGGAAPDPGRPTQPSYRITVRMDDGSYRTLAQPDAPAVAVGDAVRIADGAVAPMR